MPFARKTTNGSIFWKLLACARNGRCGRSFLSLLLSSQTVGRGIACGQPPWPLAVMACGHPTVTIRRNDAIDVTATIHYLFIFFQFLSNATCGNCSTRLAQNILLGSDHGKLLELGSATNGWQWQLLIASMCKCYWLLAWAHAADWHMQVLCSLLACANATMQASIDAFNANVIQHGKCDDWMCRCSQSMS